jgi:hypothetical protein
MPRKPVSDDCLDSFRSSRAVALLQVDGGPPLDASVPVEGVRAISEADADSAGVGAGVAFFDLLRSSSSFTMPGNGKSFELP